MAYSQVTDVRAALSPDGDAYDEDTPSNYSDEQLLDCIARADAEIDLYLRNLYTVPVQAPDALLRDWSSSIACYLAALVQANGRDIENTDPIALRYNRVLAALKAVAAGQVSLPFPSNDVPGSDDPTVINHIPDNFSILCATDDAFEFYPYGVRKSDGQWYGPGVA